jgi:hypothetical protein
MTPTPILDDSIISTDAGNGWAACYRLVNGRVRMHGIPHVRARVQGGKLMDDLTAQARYDYADFMGERYGYGDGIWDITTMPIDTHQNTERRYGSPMHIFLILVNIAEMNVKSGSELTLVVPAPPGLFNKVAPTIRQNLLAGESGKGDGVWSIQLRSDKKPRIYTIKRVIVLPEGAGAYAAYRFNTLGDPVELLDKNGDDLLAGKVEVLDLGAGTGDTMTVINGNVNPENILSSSDDQAGVIHNILQPLLNDILQAVPEATHLRTVHVDAFLRAYVNNPTPETATVRISGRTVNLEETMLSACRSYAEWIAANKIDRLWASGADAVLMAGGGWLYIASFVREWYPNRNLLSPDQFKHTRSIALYDLNGVGQLNLTAAVLRAQQV